MAHIGRMPRSQLSLPKSELSRELRAPRTSVHEAFADLSAGEALELLDRAPDPDRGKTARDHCRRCARASRPT
jgi:hypothetical protein